MIAHTAVNSVRLYSINVRVIQGSGLGLVYVRSALRDHARGTDKRFRLSPQGRLVETLTVIVNHDCFVWSGLCCTYEATTANVVHVVYSQYQ